MRHFYTVLFYLIMPLAIIRLLWRSRRLPGYRANLGQRFGYYQTSGLKKCIWVHAVSVGESIAAVPLIKSLQKQYPNLPVVVTNMTPTGAERIKAAFNDTVTQVFIPYDMPGAVQRFFKQFNPVVAIIMETELWPNLFATCKARQIPIIIANARLSEKSFAGYKRISTLTHEMLAAVTVLAAQGQADADRFIKLGLAPERAKVTGNIKFDIELPADLIARGKVLREQLGENRLVWIAASTHAGEEEIILAAHKIILQKNPQALLMLVPRHPQRFAQVAALAGEQFQVVTRSENKSCTAATEVFLGDTMGELLLFYAAADVAFVAGSLVPVGGHNTLEPAALSKPIIVGTQLFNFVEISRMLTEAHALIQITNAQELAEQVSSFFKNGEQRTQAGQRALQVVEKNRGSLARQLQWVQTLIPN